MTTEHAPLSRKPFRLDDRQVDPAANEIAGQRIDSKAMDVLLCLAAAAPGLVTHADLLACVWPNVVVGDNTVHQAIAHLRKALGDDARSPRFIENVPRRGYRLRVGVRPDPDTTRWSSRAGSEPVLAVMPFDNLSGDPDLLYFSDGVSEEILQAVSRVAGLQVIGRSSSFQFRGPAKATRQVSAALGCSHLLDGAVRRSGSRVRLSAQLIECATQTTLWSDGFESDLGDVFALQDAVATRVARALDLALLDGRGSAALDPEAFDLYLRARGTATQWLGASDAALLERVVARAPDFAEAWASLAVTRAIEFNGERDRERAVALRARVLAAADRASHLDPESPGAYVALSIIEPICGRFAERDALIARALQFAPRDSVALFWACRWSWAVGRHREALAYITRACQADPLWAQGLHMYATMLYLVGRRTQAHDLWDDLIRRWPDRDYLHSIPLLLSANDGDWIRVDQLLEGAARSGVLSGLDRTIERVERFRRWDEDETRKFAAELADEVAQTGTIRLLLQRACRMGLTDVVYALLEQASFAHLFEPWGRVHPSDYGLHALFGPDDGSMFNDRRVVRLCGRLGLCDYWVSTGRWPDCADQVSGHYDFRAEARNHLIS